MSEQTKVDPWTSESELNSIGIVLTQGIQYGWPLYQLSAWKLSPVIEGDELKLMLGNSSVTITGRKLVKIIEDLKQGNGGIIIEQGERYMVLADSNAIYVKSITIEDPFE